MRYVIGIALMLSVSGCAALFGAKQKDFDLRSQPEGADVYLDGNRLGSTPIQVKLSNLANHTFVFRKEGYKEASCTLTRGTDGGWVVLDILAGLVPVIIDAATNSWSQTKGDGCMRGLEPVAGAARTAAAPAAAPAPAAADAAGAPRRSADLQPRDDAPVPPGTRFIGDAQTKAYYSIDCPAVDSIKAGYRFYFRSEAGAQAGGYRPGGC